MRIKSLAQGENILMLGLNRQRFQGRHSKPYTVHNSVVSLISRTSFNIERKFKSEIER